MEAQRPYEQVSVTARGEAALTGGHPWVYDGEVTGTGGGVADGCLVDVVGPKGAYLGTALGCDIRNQKLHHMGHYNHLQTINAINTYGSIPAFIEGEGIDNGIIYSCVKNKVPFVLNGSIRDDGPLPEVYEHAYVGQDMIRSHVRRATTVIGMATMLHTIATGNMTPTYRVLKDGTIRPVYFYMVDSSDFVASKLGDRGSLSAKSIVTNVQDFMKNVGSGLGLYEYR